MMQFILSGVQMQQQILPLSKLEMLKIPDTFLHQPVTLLKVGCFGGHLEIRASCKKASVFARQEGEYIHFSLRIFLPVLHKIIPNNSMFSTTYMLPFCLRSPSTSQLETPPGKCKIWQNQLGKHRSEVTRITPVILEHRSSVRVLKQRYHCSLEQLCRSFEKCTPPSLKCGQGVMMCELRY